jgi:hypothetical protein
MSTHGNRDAFRVAAAPFVVARRRGLQERVRNLPNGCDAADPLPPPTRTPRWNDALDLLLGDRRVFVAAGKRVPPERPDDDSS